jgi:hypothetical protein
MYTDVNTIRQVFSILLGINNERELQMRWFIYIYTHHNSSSSELSEE